MSELCLMYQLRTVDVWDTLLRRDCHPEFVKLATARHLLLGFFDTLRQEYREQWALYRTRLECERALARCALAAGRDDEYELREVLTTWLLRVQGEDCDRPTADQLAEYEFQVETQRSFADPGIIEFLQAYPAERTLFLSDFYMDSARLRRLLVEKGLGVLVSEGVASCEVGFNKRSGRLFGHLHDVYKVAPAEHLHVGDSLVSDVEAARRVGVTAIQYLPPHTHAERTKREQLFLSRSALFEHARSACRADGAGSRGDTARREVPFRLGLEAASLFVGFALWVAEQALIRKLDAIVFCGAEGKFLGDAYTRLFPNGELSGHLLPRIVDVPLPPRTFSSEQVPASEGASFLRHGGTLRACLQRLELDEEARIGVVDIAEFEPKVGALTDALPHARLFGLWLSSTFSPLASPQMAYLTIPERSNGADEIPFLLRKMCDDVLVHADHRETRNTDSAKRCGPGEAADVRAAALFRMGVLGAIDSWRPLVQAGAVSAAELSKDALKILSALHSFDAKMMAASSKRASEDDPFGLDSSRASKTVSLAIPVIMALFKSKLREVARFLCHARWAERSKRSVETAPHGKGGWRLSNSGPRINELHKEEAEDRTDRRD